MVKIANGAFMEKLENHKEEIIENLTPEELTEKYSKELAEFYEIPIITLATAQYATKEDLQREYQKIYKLRAPLTLTTGFASPNVTHILKREEFTTGPIGESPKEHFEKVLKHETAHHYFNKINSRAPFWLNEGVSIYLANQSSPEPEEITVDLLEKSNVTGEKIYELGGYMVRQIMSNYGKEKLFELIAMESDDERYSELQKMFDWLK